MLTQTSVNMLAPPQPVPAGTAVLRRAATLAEVVHVDAGKVALGLIQGDAIEHQLGVIEGPFWLEATAAVLGLPCAVDAIAITPLTIRRVPLADFRASLNKLPEAVQSVLHDVAQAHRQQVELAVSRLAKDAEARCAEWLLRHAEPVKDRPGALMVHLSERKRMIAAQLGIAPETLSRVLRHLRERSLISGSGRTVNLVNPQGLRALAGA